MEKSLIMFAVFVLGFMLGRLWKKMEDIEIPRKRIISIGKNGSRDPNYDLMKSMAIKWMPVKSVDGKKFSCYMTDRKYEKFMSEFFLNLMFPTIKSYNSKRLADMLASVKSLQIKNPILNAPETLITDKVAAGEIKADIIKAGSMSYPEGEKNDGQDV